MERDKKLILKILRYVRDNALGDKALDPPAVEVCLRARKIVDPISHTPTGSVLAGHSFADP